VDPSPNTRSTTWKALEQKSVPFNLLISSRGNLKHRTITGSRGREIN